MVSREVQKRASKYNGERGMPGSEMPTHALPYRQKTGGKAAPRDFLQFLSRLISMLKYKALRRVL